MIQLITTSSKIENDNFQNRVYLGQWSYNFESTVENKGAVILDYHWDDRNKLHKDFLYLQELNQEIIKNLSKNLNTIHNVNYEYKYWNLLLGQWVNLFTTVLYDRWEMVKIAEKNNNFDSVCVLEDPREFLITNNLNDFSKKIISDDWNLAIFSYLFKKYTNIKLKNVNIVNKGKLNYKQKNTLKYSLKKLLNWISYIFGKNDKILLLKTSMTRSVELSIYRYAKIFFRYFDIENELQFNSSINRTIRKELKFKFSQIDKFKSILSEIISDIIPKVYLEDYKCLHSKAKNIKLPISPKIIITSNCHLNNDLFNHWCGIRRSEGSKLFIGEHGGFGTGKFNGSHNFQLNCGDLFISTGWGKKTKSFLPVGNYREEKENIKYNKHGDLLLICVSMPRYTFDIRSMALSSQILSYFDDQFKFVGNLTDEVKKHLNVRLYKQDFGWNQITRWKRNFPNIKLNNIISIKKQIKSSRLIVSSYNATNFLQTLYNDVPTVMYWNPNLWEIHQRAIPYFEKFNQLNIYHKTPLEASEFISSIWNDIDSWWFDKEVVKARNYFRTEFIKDKYTLEDGLGNIIAKEMDY